MSGDHANYIIIEIGQNTEKSSGDLRKTCCHLNSREKSSANACVKNSQKCKMISLYKLYYLQYSNLIQIINIHLNRFMHFVYRI